MIIDDYIIFYTNDVDRVYIGTRSHYIFNRHGFAEINSNKYFVCGMTIGDNDTMPESKDIDSFPGLNFK